MKYFIGSTSVIDNLYFPQEESIKGVAGGAGIYALCGAKLWTDNVELVCGVGKDYHFSFSDWYEENGLSTTKLHVMDELTPVTEVCYQSDGEREEISKYGVEHYKKFEFSIDDFIDLTSQDCGLYVFRNTEEKFWQPFIEKKQKKAKILWEIAADACFPENIDRISEIVKYVDVFSLNLTEASQIFDTSDKNEIIKQLHRFNIPLVFLRLGKEGQIFLKDGNDTFVPSIKNADIVDVTGGGNSSSGAVLIGFCEDYSLDEIGNMANLSAVMCLSQYGVPKKISRYRNKLLLKNI